MSQPTVIGWQELKGGVTTATERESVTVTVTNRKPVAEKFKQAPKTEFLLLQIKQNLSVQRVDYRIDHKDKCHKCIKTVLVPRKENKSSAPEN